MKVEQWENRRPVSAWLPAVNDRTYVTKNPYHFGKPIVDIDNCNVCGLCWIGCPEGAISKLEDHITIDYENCRGCGVCVQECPRDVIKLVQEEE